MCGETQGLGMWLIATGMEREPSVCPYLPGTLRQRRRSPLPFQRIGDQRGKATGPWSYSGKRQSWDANQVAEGWSLLFWVPYLAMWAGKIEKNPQHYAGMANSSNVMLVCPSHLLFIKGTFVQTSHLSVCPHLIPSAGLFMPALCGWQPHL